MCWASRTARHQREEVGGSGGSHLLCWAPSQYPCSPAGSCRWWRHRSLFRSDSQHSAPSQVGITTTNISASCTQAKRVAAAGQQAVTWQRGRSGRSRRGSATFHSGRGWRTSVCRSNLNICAAMRATQALSNGGLASNEPCKGVNLKKLPREPKAASVSAKREQNRGQRQLSGDAKHSMHVPKWARRVSRTGACTAACTCDGVSEDAEVAWRVCRGGARACSTTRCAPGTV